MRTLRVALVALLLAPLSAADAAPAREAPPGAWLKGDLHVHTTFSHDACDPLRVLEECPEEQWTIGFAPAGQIRQAELRGLDFLAITDHNTVAAQGDPGFASASVVLLRSYEHSMARGHAGVHGVARVIPGDTSSDAGARAVADAARAEGGLVVANHPASRPIWGYGPSVEVDAVEVWNAPWAWNDPLPAASNNAAALAFYEAMLARGEHVALVGGSDSHWVLLSAVQGVGQPTTHVLAPERSEAGILAGIRARHTFVSASFLGPELHVHAEGGIQGDELPASGASVEVRVRVVGAVGRTVFLDTSAGRAPLGVVALADETFRAHVVAAPGEWALALVADASGADVVAVASAIRFA